MKRSLNIFTVWLRTSKYKNPVSSLLAHHSPLARHIVTPFGQQMHNGQKMPEKVCLGSRAILRSQTGTFQTSNLRLTQTEACELPERRVWKTLWAEKAHGGSRRPTRRQRRAAGGCPRRHHFPLGCATVRCTVQGPAHTSSANSSLIQCRCRAR